MQRAAVRKAQKGARKESGKGAIMNTEGLPKKPKTDAQRNSLHLWFEQVAEVLNDNCIDKRVVIEKLITRGIDMPWTKDSFKADVYKPIYQKVTATHSTEDASTTDHDLVYHGLVKWFGQEFGIVLPPWPSLESQMNESLGRNAA